MSRIGALVARELRSLVFSPIAWIVWTLFLFVAGWFFFSSVYQFSAIVATYAGMGQEGALDRLNLNDFVIAGLFQNLLVLFLFLVPALTMRGFADERRQGTDELLLTAPVTPGQLVAGKYLGLLAVALVLVAGAGFYLVLITRYGDPEKGPILTGLLGLTLALAALVALGFAVSSTTRSPVVAAVGAFVTFLLLFVVDWPAESTSGWLQTALRALSMPSHFDGFTRGTVASVDVVYFLSLIALGLFAARTTLASQRWR